MNEMQHNPFAVTQPQDQELTMARGTISVEQTRAQAQVQAAIISAKKFPRNKAIAYAEIMEACKRRGLAEAATYRYSRGGQTVTGPSIRLAEELMRCWGNMEAGIQQLSSDSKGSEMQAFCWDYETNSRKTMNFIVPHERHAKAGIRMLTDPRDIYEVVANNGARRLRACILALLPPDLVEDAVEACRKTLAGDNSIPIADRVKKMVNAFGKIGVSAKQLEARLTHPLDEMTPDELAEYHGIYNSIRDGQQGIRDWFGGGATGGGEVQNIIDRIDRDHGIQHAQPWLDAVKDQFDVRMLTSLNSNGQAIKLLVRIAEALDDGETYSDDAFAALLAEVKQ